MKPSAALIVRKTALYPLYGLWSGGVRTYSILIGPTSDAAHQKARDVLRFMPKRLFYVAVAKPGAAFSVFPTQYSIALQIRVGVHAEFFHVEHTGQRWPADWAAFDVAAEEPLSPPDGKRASTQVSLVRLAAVLRYTQAARARIAKAAGAIFAAQLSSS